MAVFLGLIVSRQTSAGFGLTMIAVYIVSCGLEFYPTASDVQQAQLLPCIVSMQTWKFSFAGQTISRRWYTTGPKG